MNHTAAMRAAAAVSVSTGQGRQVSFVSPMHAAVLAAARIRNPRVAEVEFVGDASRYADTVGLTDALAGNNPGPSRGYLEGETYSPLTRLADDDDVERCNDTISACLHYQLASLDAEVVNSISRVVGELHDNIAAHSRGAGFSAAQVYNPLSGRGRVELAVADSGVGLLFNARRVDQQIQRHLDAIRWAKQRGTTSARSGSWAQRLPRDALSSPFGDGVETRTTENHHLGMGLPLMVDVTKALGGCVWICTGTAGLTMSMNRAALENPPVEWKGTAIEISVPTSGFNLENLRRSIDRGLAERLGL